MASPIQAVLGLIGPNTGGNPASPGAVGSAIGNSNTVVGFIFYYTGGADTIISVTDNLGVSWPLLDHITDGTGNFITTFARTNINTAPTTLTANFSGTTTNNEQVGWLEYSGLVAGAIGGHGGQTQSNPGTAANVITAGSVSSGVNTTVVGFCGTGGFLTITAGTGFTQRLHDTLATGWGAFAEDQTATGNTVAVTFTDSTHGGGGIYLSAAVVLAPPCYRSLLGAGCYIGAKLIEDKTPVLRRRLLERLGHIGMRHTISDRH